MTRANSASRFSDRFELLLHEAKEPVGVGTVDDAMIE
jgi:hypothetical protein